MLPPNSSPDELAVLFSGKDNQGQRSFIENCPPARMKTAALTGLRAYLDARLLGLCMLAEDYSRGRAPELGINMSRAIWTLAQKGYAENKSAGYLIAARQSARIETLGMRALGQHDEILRRTAGVIAWLELAGDAAETVGLYLDQAEAHLHKAQLLEAGAALKIAQSRLQPAQTTEKFRLKDLHERLARIAEQRATDLPAKPVSDRETILAARRNMLEQLSALKEQMGGADEAELQKALTLLEDEIDKNVPETLTEYAAGQQRSKPAVEKHLTELRKVYPQLQGGANQSLMDVLTDFISGGGREMNQLQNQKRLRNASMFFADPVRGHDPTEIGQAIPILREAADWAREHGFTEDENDALYPLYLGYNRLERFDDAIGALERVWQNLEGLRARVADPLKRAGVFRTYPHLFGALCQLYSGTGRKAELLRTIESGKGRALADSLMMQGGEAVTRSELLGACEQLPQRMLALRAHYLTFYVDSDKTFAVLVARDGSMHSQEIPLGRAELENLAKTVDPRHWTRPAGGLFRKEASLNLPERLSPLINWLQPLVESGLLQKGDHLCYCPDETLHLLPLQYVHFRGAPLVHHLSISRIQSVEVLLKILGRPLKPYRTFKAVEVPAIQDITTPGKRETLGKAGAWLEQHLTGTRGSGESVDLAWVQRQEWSRCIAHFATHGTFPRRDQENRDPNPYTGSGLALAQAGRLPDLGQIAAGSSNDTLLTPERAMSLNFDGSHVTLQACVSGLAKEGLGGDALGLEWAFLLAGASSLLVSHWNADARPSAEFVTRFYEKWLAHGGTRASAWRECILERIAAGKGVEDWAAFSLTGDWR